MGPHWAVSRQSSNEPCSQLLYHVCAWQWQLMAHYTVRPLGWFKIKGSTLANDATGVYTGGNAAVLHQKPYATPPLWALAVLTVRVLAHMQCVVDRAAHPALEADFPAAAAAAVQVPHFQLHAQVATNMTDKQRTQTSVCLAIAAVANQVSHFLLHAIGPQ